MALSALTPLSKEEYQALELILFEYPPRRTDTGDQIPALTFELGGWRSNNVMAFKLYTVAQNTSTMVLNEAGTEIVIDVSADAGADASWLYRTVDTGVGNGRPSEWSLTVEAKKKVKKSKWVFAKGKVDDSDTGLLGQIIAWLKRLFGIN